MSPAGRTIRSRASEKPRGRAARQAGGPVDVDRLMLDNDALGRELFRCYEQLGLFSELAESFGRVEDRPRTPVELLQRLLRILDADALFLDADGCCRRAPGGSAACAAPSPRELRARLHESIEEVRHACGARLVPLSPDADARSGRSVALLAALPRAEADAAVAIAWRGAQRTPFDSGDLIAAQSVLRFGAQALRNVELVRSTRDNAVETVCALANAIDAKDNYTCGHSERVGQYGRMLGTAIGLGEAELTDLEFAGLLHDVGKIGVPEHVLNKPQKLTRDEQRQIRLHPQIGYDVLKPVRHFQRVLDAVLHHHENHDGSGYPAGLRGDNIPQLARILHVADIFDALTTDRPYRAAYGREAALRILESGAGTITDPDLTAAFVEAIRSEPRS